MVPQEMIDACASVAAGAACSFTLSKRTIEGRCAELPDQTLACRPGGPKKAKAPAKAKAPSTSKAP